MTAEQDETPDAGYQCKETCNPGTWPYIARCVLPASPAHTWHETAKGQGWSA